MSQDPKQRLTTRPRATASQMRGFLREHGWRDTGPRPWQWFKPAWQVRVYYRLRDAYALEQSLRRGR